MGPPAARQARTFQRTTECGSGADNSGTGPCKDTTNICKNSSTRGTPDCSTRSDNTPEQARRKSSLSAQHYLALRNVLLSSLGREEEARAEVQRLVRKIAEMAHRVYELEQAVSDCKRALQESDDEVQVSDDEVLEPQLLYVRSGLTGLERSSSLEVHSEMTDIEVHDLHEF